MNILQADQAMTDKQRSDVIFSGDLIVFRQLPAMLALCEYANDFMLRSLNGTTPEEAQHHLPAEAYRQFVSDTQQRFQGDSEAKAMFFRVLQEAGIELRTTYYDYFSMRVVSAQQKFTDGLRAVVGHHRDTWGSNVQAQCNWWAPLYDLQPERSIAFYPDYWQKPTRNTTGDWDFKEYLAARRATPDGEEVPYPAVPQLLQSIEEDNVVKVVIEAGDVLCFSSAHLHASVPNTTNLARFSVEMRTINLTDLEAGRGAPNTDNAGKEPRYNWYRHTVDDISLSKKMV